MKKILIMLAALCFSAQADDKVYSEGLALPVSQKSIDHIIYYEVGGRSLYNAKYTKPIVPAWQTTSSGVTVGFGLDVGYNTKDQIRKALQGVASEDEIVALQSVAGLKGKNAYYNGLPKVRNKVHFTYEEAEKIFMRDSLVRFTKLTADTFDLKPDRLSPDCNGALTSIVFNRGSALEGDRRKEMRWIKYNIATGHEEKVPSDILSMKRIWDYTKLKGLHLRYDAISKLFKEGLK